MSHRSSQIARAFLAALLVASCGTPAPPEAAAPRLVRFERIAAQSSGRLRSFAGTARTERDPRLSFKVAGTITELPVKVGDRLSAGRLIAEVDPTDYHLSLQDAEAGLRRAEAEARNAAATFGRTRDLYENGNAARTDYDAARAAAESSEAAVESARQRLELARRQLDYTKLRAPVAGTIASVAATVNENVQAGQEIVMFLEQASNLEVEIAMPESLIAHCRRGAPVTVRFDSQPGRSFEAHITEVGVAATSSGTTFPVTVRLDGATSGARAGMAAEVEFRFGEDDTAGRPRLPSHAVGEDREGRFVFVVEPESGGLGVVRKRTVEVGELTAGGIEMLAGVAEGDLVVTAGVGSLRDGDTVRLPEAD